MERRLIATRCDENNKSISDMTHPILKQYAEKCGADFLVISDCKDLHMHYRILQFYDLFEKYDKILSVDSDVIITKRCPNIFEVVPDGMIASVYEDVGSRRNDRRSRIKAVQKKFGDVGWESGYINTGFALFPSYYKDIFKIESKDDLWDGLGFDDVFLGYRIKKFGYKFYELPIAYNYMSLFQEKWSSFKSRGEAFVVHYAGSGGFAPARTREEIIKEDILVLRKYGMV